MLGARFLRQALDGLGAIDFLEATKKSLIYGTGSELARPCSGQACSLQKSISTRLVCYPSSFKNYSTIQGVRRLGNIIKQDSLHSFGITIDGHYRVSQGMTEFLLLT